MDSLVENFSVVNRRFTEKEVEAFNDRRDAFRSNIKNRKWIFNEFIYTPEQFQKRIKMHAEGVWSNRDIVDDVKKQNEGKEDLTVEPPNIRNLLDHSGLKFGVTNTLLPGWTPMRK